MSESIRSFIAFDINEESVITKMKDVQASLANTGAHLKMVKPENIHVTMHFLGNISFAMIEKIHEKMRKIEYKTFNIKIKGIGVFPHLRYIRVIWAGITEGADHLKNISIQLESYLQKLGFPRDRKGFSPHLTIARVKSSRARAELTKFVEDNSIFEFGTIRAECLKLKKSTLTPKGPVYSTLKIAHSQQ
ncbi:MAG: RNA 2',3'-cyclic phosphodiesterase [Candidatus Bathyarchaeota archaeon]|jgi:2'-5' RNA ligase